MNKLILISLLCLMVVNCYKEETFTVDSLDKSILEFSELSDCNSQGYKFDEKCYCFSGYSGDKCLKETGQGWYDKPGGCDNLALRLGSLLNQNPDSPKDKYVQDNEFPRITGDSIGKGKVAYGAKGNTWIQMVPTPTPVTSIFPETFKIQDIVQGSLKDSYFLAALASLASFDKGQKILKAMFMNIKSDANIYVSRWFLNGKPVFVSVNDWFPGFPGNNRQGREFSFAQQKNKAYWVQILEKSWAKMFGTYERIEGGSQADVWSAITQAPNVQKHTKDHNAEQTFDELLNAFNNKYPMGAQTYIDGRTKLVPGHSYAVLGLYKGESKEKPYKLVKCYNPQGKHDKYEKNPWKKTSDKWTTELKTTLGVTAGDDGTFFLDHKDFHQNFEVFSYAEIKEDYQVQFKDITLKNKQGYQLTQFEINVKDDQKEFSIAFLPVNKRLLKGCQKPYNVGSLLLITPSNKKIFANWGGAGNYRIKLSGQDVEKGVNQVLVYVKTETMDHPYFSISFYSPQNFLTFVDPKNQDVNALNNNQHPEKQCPNKCNNHGVCNLFNGKCKCDFLFKGDSCEKTNTNKCPKNCGDKGNCVKYVCQCFTGFTKDQAGSCDKCKDVENKDCSKSQDQGFCTIPANKKNCMLSCKTGTCGSGAYQCSTQSCEHGTCNGNICSCSPGFTKKNGANSCTVCSDDSSLSVCQQYRRLNQCTQEVKQKQCKKTCGFGTCDTGIQHCPFECGGYGTCQDNVCQCNKGYTLNLEKSCKKCSDTLDSTECELKKTEDKCADVTIKQQCMETCGTGTCNTEDNALYQNFIKRLFK